MHTLYTFGLKLYSIIYNCTYNNVLRLWFKPVDHGTYKGKEGMVSGYGLDEAEVKVSVIRVCSEFSMTETNTWYTVV